MSDKIFNQLKKDMIDELRTKYKVIVDERINTIEIQGVTILRMGKEMSIHTHNGIYRLNQYGATTNFPLTTDVVETWNNRISDLIIKQDNLEKLIHKI